VSETKCLLLVGKVRPERKRSLTGMAVAAELPLVPIEESSEAIAWLDANDPGCVLVDAGASRLDRLIAKVRSKPQLSHVPVLSLVSAPDDLWIEQYFGWGGDDVVHVDAGSTLLERLRAVPREAPTLNAARRVLIGDPDRPRADVFARVFGLAGFVVDSVADRESLENHVTRQMPPLVLANSNLGELPEVIARTRQNGSSAAWIVMAGRRELDAQQAALSAVDRCIVTGIQANPWQLLYRSNELTSRIDDRRGELRRPFGSFVLFRAAGSDDDDVGVAYNLSSGGMFVRTFAPVLSDDVWLEWRVPQDKTRVRLEGRVAWRQASLCDTERPASPLGFGVEFRDYLGGARKLLERALEVLDGYSKRSLSSRPCTRPDDSVEPQAADQNEVSQRTAPSSPSPTPQGSSATTGNPVPPTQPAAKAGLFSQPPSPAWSATSKGPLGIKPLSSMVPGTKAAGGNSFSQPPIAKDVSSDPERTPAKTETVAPGDVSERTASPAQSRLVSGPSQPSTRASSRPSPTKSILPPRPTGASFGTVPPRPVRSAVPNAPAGTSATNLSAVPSGNGGEPLAASPEELSIRRVSESDEVASVPCHDTPREHAAFHELCEKTDPNAENTGAALSDAAPTSSEPTEVSTNPPETIEGAEEGGHPSTDVASEDAPTVVTNVLDPTAGEPQPTNANPFVDAAPVLMRPDEPNPLADERGTHQWSPIAVEAPCSLGDDVTASSEHRRRNRSVLAVSVVFAIAGLSTAGLVIYRSGVVVQPHRLLPVLAGNKIPVEEAPSPVVSEPSVVSPPPAASTGPEAAASTAPEAAASVQSPAANASAESRDAVPWAKLDEGSPLDGYPPVEDLQRGKGKLLADRYGYLVVRFPEAAFIFANNVPMGATNWKLPTTCGEKVLRIGVGEKPVTWLSDEARVNVACRDTTQVVFRRLDGVVAPSGAARPIAPGTIAAHKSSVNGSDVDSGGSTSGVLGAARPMEPESGLRARDGKPKELTTGSPGETVPGQKLRGLVDTRE
jgi:DNA-binding response OmpR family regulator